MKIVKAFITTLAFVSLGGCSAVNDVANSDDDSKLKVVATTTMLTDLLKEIGEGAIQVEGLMGPGVDPHGYQASSSDVTKLFDADIVVYNGFQLEGKLTEVFENLEKQDKTLFVLEEALDESDLLESQEDQDSIDPHIWFSVENWKLAADYITAELSEVDPDNQSTYELNNKRYQEELTELDEAIKVQIQTLPEEQKYLVTAHDAFGYFGDAYGFEVIGLQGINTQAEAGTGDVSALAEFIAENQINAIFVESSVPTKTIESLQEAVKKKGWQVEIGGELFSDALGDTSQDAETYVKMYLKNVTTIIEALK